MKEGGGWGLKSYQPMYFFAFLLLLKPSLTTLNIKLAIHEDKEQEEQEEQEQNKLHALAIYWPPSRRKIFVISKF